MTLNELLNCTDPIAKYLGYDLNIFSILLRIVLSVVFASIIGCERATKRHAAGLRTFILTCLATTSAMMLDTYLMDLLGVVFPLISAATVVGLATISSNTILFSSKNQIKGLTTASGLWFCGILGLIIGAGLYTVSLICFIALISCLSLLPRFEVYLKNKSNHFEIHLELKDKDSLRAFVSTIRKLGLKIDDIEMNPAYINSGLSVYSVSLTIQSSELKQYKTHKEIIEALSSLEYVSHIEEMN